jgi:serine/threonine-protein kinase
MSPEQASGERELDGRSDIFALACVLYELLAGEPPFHGPTPQATLMRRFTGPPRPLRPVVQVSEATEAALIRALARNPSDRFATAREFADALSGSTPGRPAPAPAAAGEEPSRRKGCAAVVLFAAAGISALLLATVA